jgi:amino acid transporter
MAMTGSSLVGFLVSLIVLSGVTAIFFIAIDKVAKDQVLAKIAKIAVGCLIVIYFVLAVAGVLGFGGGAVSASPWGVIIFAIGVLVLLAVLYIVDLFLPWLAGKMGMGAPVVSAIQYVITILAIIALLVVAGEALLSGSVRWPFAHASYDSDRPLPPRQDRDLGVR